MKRLIRPFLTMRLGARIARPRKPFPTLVSLFFPTTRALIICAAFDRTTHLADFTPIVLLGLTSDPRFIHDQSTGSMVLARIAMILNEDIRASD